MTLHRGWLALSLLLVVVLACNLGKKTSNSNSNSNNSNSSTSKSSESGPISEVHMAKDDGTGNPGDETDVFSSGDRTVHCVVKLGDAKSGTKMNFAWYVVDAEGAKNEKIKEVDYTTKALENVVHAHLSLPQDWPAGKYKVQVSVNGNLEKTVDFTVQ